MPHTLLETATYMYRVHIFIPKFIHEPLASGHAYGPKKSKLHCTWCIIYLVPASWYLFVIMISLLHIKFPYHWGWRCNGIKQCIHVHCTCVQYIHYKFTVTMQSTLYIAWMISVMRLIKSFIKNPPLESRARIISYLPTCQPSCSWLYINWQYMDFNL